MRVGVFGAGAVGAYVGVRLSSVSCDVTLIGRRKLVEIAPKLSARNIRLDVARPKALVATEDVSALRGADVILVTVKSTDTRTAMESLRSVVTPDTLVVSLQNGVRNVEILKELDADVVPGMVTFNVVWKDAHLEQATSGPILVGTAARRADLLNELVKRLRQAKEHAGVRKNIVAIQHGKLIINLINGICAVSGLPSVEVIQSRTLRRVAAACMREGLSVMKRAGRPVSSIGVLSPWLIARLLPVPDWILNRVAKRMVEVDPSARSSTLQDLDRGKTTEIDHLNGEIVRIAESLGIDAPANRFITDRVHDLETQDPKRFLTPEEVYRGSVVIHPPGGA